MVSVNVLHVSIIVICMTSRRFLGHISGSLRTKADVYDYEFLFMLPAFHCLFMSGVCLQCCLLGVHYEVSIPFSDIVK